MDRGGGEAQVVTSFKGDVLDYDWSPGRQAHRADRDGRRSGPCGRGREDKTPPPIVIDRYYFKEDETGYLGALRRHLYVIDVAYAQGRAADAGQIRRSLARLVARRIADRVRQQARTRIRIAATTMVCTSSLPGPAARRDSSRRSTATAGDSGWMTRPSWRPDGRRDRALGRARSRRSSTTPDRI